MFEQLQRAGVQLPGFPMDEKRHGHTPLPLARKGPVRPVCDHAVQARLSPGGKELGIFNAAQRSRAKRFGRLGPVPAGHRVHAGEPLDGGTQDHRCLVAPAVHVAVDVALGGKQHSALPQFLDNLRVGLPDHHPAEERQRRHVFSVAHDRREDIVIFQAVAPAGIEILHAIRGRRMHDTGARIERYVVAEIDWRQAVVKGMPEADVFKRGAFARSERLALELVPCEACGLKVGRQDQQPFAGIDQVVVDFRVDIKRLVCRQRPRRSGPYDGEARLVRKVRQTESLGEFIRFGECETGIHGDVLAVLVLDFRFGQRRTAIEAPVHRLETAKDVAFLKQHTEGADLVRFVAGGHCEVRVVPVAEHAQTLEILFLPLDLLGSIRAAKAKRFLSRQIAAVEFLDLGFDRHAVAIPSGYVRRIEPGHELRFDDCVLEDLVYRVADMDVAVGIRRPIVQHESWPSARDIPQALV